MFKLFFIINKTQKLNKHIIKFYNHTHINNLYLNYLFIIYIFTLLLFKIYIKIQNQNHWDLKLNIYNLFIIIPATTDNKYHKYFRAGVL